MPLILTILELALLSGGAFVWLRQQQVSRAAALSLAILGSFTALSFIYQSVFLLGWGGWAALFEIPLCMASAILCFQQRHILHGTGQRIRQHWRAAPVTISVLAIALSTLLLLVIVVPEGNFDSQRYNLTRVLLFEQFGTLRLGPGQITEYHQAIFPVGGDILRYALLRWHTDAGLALFNWLAYIAIISGSYALARGQTDEKRALLVALIIASLPLPIFQATGTKPDLLLTAAVIGCFLLGRTLLAQPRFCWLAALTVLLAFGISLKTTFAAFALPFMLCFGGWWLWQVRTSISTWLFNWHWIALLPVLLVFSQIWLFAHNYSLWSHWAGPVELVDFHRNQDGAFGALANALRYWLQSLHLMTPSDLLANQLIGTKLSTLLTEAYYAVLYPLIGDAGAAWPREIVPFVLAEHNWGDGENGAWFGPLGFVLIWPALVLALWRGDAWLRVMALSLLGFFVIVCWQVAWMPWNGRFLTPVFVAAAGPLAWLLNHITRNMVLNLLRGAAFLLLIYGCVFNQQKPLLNPGAVLTALHLKTELPKMWPSGIFAATDWGQDRHYFARRYHGDAKDADRIQQFATSVPTGARVAVASRYLGWLFPYMIARPDVYFSPIQSTDSGSIDASKITGDYVLCINQHCDFLATSSWALLWQRPQANQPQQREGALWQYRQNSAQSHQ